MFDLHWALLPGSAPATGPRNQKLDTPIQPCLHATVHFPAVPFSGRALDQQATVRNGYAPVRLYW